MQKFFLIKEDGPVHRAAQQLYSDQLLHAALLTKSPVVLSLRLLVIESSAAMGIGYRCARNSVGRSLISRDYISHVQYMVGINNQVSAENKQFLTKEVTRPKAVQSIYAAHFNKAARIIMKHLLHVINTALRKVLLLFLCFF